MNRAAQALKGKRTQLLDYNDLRDHNILAWKRLPETPFGNRLVFVVSGKGRQEKLIAQTEDKEYVWQWDSDDERWYRTDD